MNKFIKYSKITDNIGNYKNNQPFPHSVIDNLWDEEFLKKVKSEVEVFDKWDGIKEFDGSIGKRYCNTPEKLPPNVLKTLNYCNSAEFLIKLENLTGELGLIPDPFFFGGGIHSTTNNGFLEMHVDFNWYEKLRLYRRLNVLIYLNIDWDLNWAGDLILANLSKNGFTNQKKISPIFNRTVIFTTTDNSFHGHPQKLKAPYGISRNSLALYYYVSEKPLDSGNIKRIGTDYRNAKGKVLVNLRRRIIIKLKNLIPERIIVLSREILRSLTIRR